jgi:hypothetical protein
MPIIARSEAPDNKKPPLPERASKKEITLDRLANLANGSRVIS